MSLPPVSTFGDLFPSKFTAWRGDQPRAILRTIDNPLRFAAHAAPTGFGKSLVYIAIAQLTGWRTCILTSTKGLQEQLIRDFNGDGVGRLVDIRGQNAYRCIKALDFDFPEYTTCDYAPCHAGRQCASKEAGCLYYDQYRKASRAQVVITNYSYWLSINKYGQGLGEFDLLVLDEAHDASDIIAEFMGIEIEPHELIPANIKMIDTGADLRQWKEWAAFNLPKVKARVESLQGVIRIGDNPKSIIREASELKRLAGKLESLGEMEDDWITEKIDKFHSGKPSGYAMRFDPLWPWKSAESLLFRDVPKVMLVSATLRPKTCTQLGIDPAELDFNEYNSSFPIARRPVIHIPTVAMNHRTPPENIAIWQRRIDQILMNRQDRRGIIHTVSFARAKGILSSSEYAHVMLLNESKNTKWTVERYKSMSAPVILVSPSVTTGYDFPYQECEYQIIGKLPFPDNRAKVVKARMEHDKEYSNYITMQTLIQMCGRGMRADDDSCETLITDDSFVWFIKHNRKFAPKWFLDAIVWASSIPKPLPKL